MSVSARPTLLIAIGLALACGRPPAPVTNPRPPAAPRFELAASCMACHSGLITPLGEDVSFGSAWRATMMASSAVDPYWRAGVRRELLDHPTARTAIENECSRCHMPMAHELTRSAGGSHPVFAATAPLALEGVSCSLCHQIGSERLGERASFTGGFVIGAAAGRRPMFGPYQVAPGHARVMRSATGAEPVAGPHVQRSELCATCHTLYTHALDGAGKTIGALPEQVPYEEWLNSAYRDTRSCQSCHMPEVAGETSIASVLGPPRAAVSRHDFRGANFLVLSMLNAHRADLGVTAAPLEIDAAVARSRAFLQTSAARVTIGRLARDGARLEAEVVVENLAGHKLPTAYPSRRVWLRVTVHDGAGGLVFASGQLDANGRIQGNDNDLDAARFEPHHAVIRSSDEVQVYEAILGDPAGGVTTGLLTAVSYLKDNRVPPRGFDKRSAPPEVAVAGAARDDADFGGGEDRVRYAIDLGDAAGPFTVQAELLYQSIGFRWAENLRGYDAIEPRRFVGYYDAMASRSAERLAGDRAVAR